MANKEIKPQFGDIFDFGYLGSYTEYPKLNVTDKFSLIRHQMMLMFIKTNTMFEYGGDFGKGKSDKITKRYMELVIQSRGYCAVVKKNDKLYATYGTLGGRPRWDYLPSNVIVANPYIPFYDRLKLDENVVVIPNDSMYYGLMPLHLYYATKMTDNDLSRRMLMVNTRALNLLLAKDSDVFSSVMEVLKKLENGELSAILDDTLEVVDSLKAIPFGTEKSSQTFIQLLEDMQYCRGSWWNDMGVQSNYNMKRESITSSENILNIDSLMPFADTMLEQRQIAVEKINKMFDVSWTVDYSSAWKKLRKELKLKEEQLEKETENIGKESVTVTQNKESGGKQNENAKNGDNETK